ncbi:hypothetical protein PCANC_22134 [Puccinia coronata f. sp. avenae]|uniref:RING-type E3 ubiquitin transferase n=1 Tax=Puccinia coronata f. sp. avenae TaxID=200324 RepID=A0A2N5SHE9_9BASI|nr:hypothetical protein PCANC_22134 [Puccinia coronata f. sp. avenae]
MSTSSQPRQVSPREAPAPRPRQGRRGKAFGALLTTSDAADSSPGAPNGSSRPSTHASSSEATAAQPQGASRQPSKQHTRSKKRDAHPPRLSNDNKPQTEDSVSSQQAEPDPRTKQSPLATAPQSQSTLIQKSSDAADSGETCLICAESIKYFALGSCSHRTCHICSIRMRALYKKRECALCKTELHDVILTTDPQAFFSSYDLASFKFKDPHLAMYCETFEQLDELLAYLKFNCPHPDCTSVLSNWKDLKFHTRTAHHGLSLCDLCCTNKRVFAHEHTLFTAKGLIMHMNQGSVGVGKGLRRSRFMAEGDTATGADDDDGFQGHPRCGFCSVYYYDDDQLYQHCRDKHEQCFICVRNGVGRWQYYLDYKHLESHFRDDHHLCSQQNCLQSRFVVYETALELQAHQIEVHGAEMGMKAIKDARKLETNFVYVGGQEQHLQIHANRPATREQRAGRGITVMDIPPISGEASTTLSNANRVVPGLAPPSERSNSRRPHKGKSKSDPADEPEDPSLPSCSHQANANHAASSSSNNYDLQRHAALIKRVAEAVNGVEAKTTSFKAAVKTYRNNEMGAPDFLDTLCSIFDHRPEVMGPILSNLLDILDIGDDRKGQLLEKWLDLKLDQTQYPSLDGSSSKGPLVGNHSGFQSGSSASALGSLQTSSWVREQPRYHKLVQTDRSARNPSREVPGLVPKKLKSGGKSTPWASGSTSTTTVVSHSGSSTPRAAATTAASSKSVSGVGAGPSGVTQNAHFPSLPTKAAPKHSWKPNGGPQDEGATARWVSPTDHLPSTSTNPAAAAGNKKPKKILLFTNSR